MKPVTAKNVRKRMNELGQRISSGRLSLSEEFELECLRKLLALMESRDVKTSRPAPVVLLGTVTDVYSYQNATYWVVKQTHPAGINMLGREVYRQWRTNVKVLSKNT